MDINQLNENIALESVQIVTGEVNRRALAALKSDLAASADAYEDQPEETTSKKPKPLSGLRKDTKTIFLLMFLYFLQGLPMGLLGAITFILGAKKVSYSDQGMFSFANWPFSIKLLWAPIVDSIYLKRFGRRKSWLVSVQLLIGVLMFSLGSFCQNLVNNIQGKEGI
jgi:PAT family acetyl-CoA transporter-like MFS transporter 1